MNVITMPCVYEITVNSWTERPVEQPISPESNAITNAPESDSTPSSPKEEVVAIARYVEEHGRAELWRLLGLAIYDIPFNIIGLFVLLTFWRSGELWKNFTLFDKKRNS